MTMLRSVFAAAVAAIFLAAPALAFNAGAIPAVTTSAATAGQALASMQTVTLPGAGNVLGQITVESQSGSTVPVVVYVWDNVPSGTTCTAGSNFAPSQADNLHLIAPPQLIALATVASAHDAHTYGVSANLAGFFSNGGGASSLSYCLVANGSVTPASASDYTVKFSGNSVP